MKQITWSRICKLEILISLVALFGFNELDAQVTFSWASGFKKPFVSTPWTPSCEGKGISQDSNGNSYITGVFSGPIDFDPSLLGYSILTAPMNQGLSLAAFILKLDANGNLVWVKMINGTQDVDGVSIEVDINDKIYVTGDFAGTVDFDPGAGVFNMTSTLDLGNIGIGSNDAFLLKLDSNGNFIWAKSWGGGGADYGKALAVDAIGNVYTTGMFCQSYDTIVDFDPGVGTYNLTTPTSSGTLFISKLDANGNFIWAKAPSSGNESDGTAITIDMSNNILITGNFQGNVDFDFGTGVSNFVSQAIPLVISDLFALKLDANGNFIWAKSIENTRKYSQVAGRAITSDALGNVIIALNVREQPGGAYGPYRSTDMNPGVGVNNLPFAWCCSNPINAYVVKLNSIGNFLWAKKLTDSVPSDADVRGIKVDACGNIFTTGTFYGIADFDPSASGVYTLTGIGGSNTFISQLSSSGNFVWAGRFEASESNSIYVNSNGDIFTTGWFGDNVNFDPGIGSYILNAFENTDAYVSKLAGTNCITVLPIELVSFTANCIPSLNIIESPKVILDWSTSSETNNNYFTIERSYDALTWEAIGKLNGSGNSNNILNYSFVDQYSNPSEETNKIKYYRLKQTDFNGSIHASYITVSSNCDSNKNSELKVYPNPASETVSIELLNNEQQNLTIQICDIFGRIIKEEAIKNIYAKKCSSDISMLNPGTYFIKVNNSDRIIFIKQ